MSSVQYRKLISTVQAPSMCRTGISYCIVTLTCVQILQPLHLGFPLLYRASSPWKSLLVGPVQYILQCDLKLVVVHGMLLWGLWNAFGARGGIVVKALRFKPAVHGFNSRWRHWNFSVTWSFWSHYGPGVDSASNRNEYQVYFLVVKSAGV